MKNMYQCWVVSYIFFAKFSPSPATGIVVFHQFTKLLMGSHFSFPLDKVALASLSYAELVYDFLKVYESNPSQYNPLPILIWALCSSIT